MSSGFVLSLMVMVLLFSGAAICLAADEQGAGADAALRVMSFNVRNSRAADGPNAWPLRTEIFFETIMRYNPDLLGTQEVRPDQAQLMCERLRDYGFVGVGRDDGKEAGEFAAIFFKRDRFEKLDEGHFWLSETPEVPGSRSWDANLHRIVSWAKLRDKKTNQELLFVNTHWDHIGRQARLESAKLMRRKLSEIEARMPIIITGDFNATEDDEPYEALVNPGDGSSPELTDTYREAHPARTTDEATFHGFKGTRAGSRIDWILHTPHFQTIGAAIDTYNVERRYPSDHYPVTAELRWK